MGSSRPPKPNWSQPVCLIRPSFRHQVPKSFPATPNGYDVEAPKSLALLSGKLNNSEILEKLGTGLYVNNLWYLNYSDVSNARITGMTRFATYWVENGQIVCPTDVHRFDDTAYRFLGDQLEDLTCASEDHFSDHTYFYRARRSSKMPGALLKELRIVS